MAQLIHTREGAPGEVTVGVSPTDVETESATPHTDDDYRRRDAIRPKMELMRRQFKSIVEGSKEYREAAAEDARFRAGTIGNKRYQWDDTILERRESLKRPCVTVNKAQSYIHQITNQARKARLRIHVSPVDDASDPKTAEIIQGLVRNVESVSFADRAYSMGNEKQAEQGLGYLFLDTQWGSDDLDDPDSLFKVEARIRRVRDPLSVYTDLSAEEADFADADFQFRVHDVDADSWKLITGLNNPPTTSLFSEFDQSPNAEKEWFPNGQIRIVRWWNREPHGEKKHMALLSDGKVLPYPTEKQLKKLARIGITVKRERWVQPMKMIARICDALDIHEESVWEGDAVPHVPVIGDELLVDGKLDWRGCLRDSRDAARVYNVMISALIEAVGMGQKAPMFGVQGQFGAEGTKMRQAWERALTEPLAFLEYMAIEIGGKAADRPQPLQITPEIEGIVVAIRQANNDYDATAGFHDASLGERGPQESGVAIDARKQQDELGSSHYIDNLRFAMSSLGRQLIRVLRKTLDVATVVRITGSDDQHKKVMVYSGADQDPRQPKFLKRHPMTAQPMGMPDGSVVAPGQHIPFQLPKGVSDIFDIGIGKYDVEVNAAPDPGTKRQEELETIVGVFKTLPPEIAMKFIDLEFALIDSAIGRQLVERAKKVFPDLADDQGDEQQQIPPQAKAMLMKATQERDQAMKVAQQLHQALESDFAKQRAVIQKAKMDNQTTVYIQTIKDATAITVAQIAAMMKGLQMKSEAANEAMALGHEANLALLDDQNQAKDRTHDVGMAMQAHRQQLEQIAQQHAAAMQQAQQQHSQALDQSAQEHSQALDQGVQEAALNPPAPEGDGGAA